jgi:hypothetical protein
VAPCAIEGAVLSTVKAALFGAKKGCETITYYS